jgi:hypothetical protein
MVLSLVYCLLLGQLRLSELQVGSIGWVVGIFQVFFLGTWVVRRTVRLDFPAFHLVVVRGDAPERIRSMNYRESLSVNWLLCWRSAMIAALVYLLVYAAFWVVLGLQPVGSQG